MRQIGALILLSIASATSAAPLVDREVPTTVTSISREQLDQLPVGQTVEDLLRTCPAMSIPTISRPAPTIRGLERPFSLQCMRPESLESVEIYREHNAVREQFGSRPLVWDPLLVDQARSYGPILGRYDHPVHSSRTGREWSRENLLQALPNTPVDRMMNVWTRERSYFTPGVFPNVSTTGDWSAVGHYTQIVWPETTAVGCAVQRGIGHYDWMICRYSPPGNRDGVPLFFGAGGSTVIAGDSGIAPPNSGSQTAPPPPPPPPTATDEAPGGNEDNHPLVGYGAEAFIRHSVAVDCGDAAGAAAELAKLRYAIDELKKRLRAARKAKAYSAVKPEDVQRQINLLESFLKAAEARKPKDKCPITPPPPPPPPAPPPPR